MAKVYGIIGNTTTGFTAVGTVRTYTRTSRASVNYSRDADNAPDGSVASTEPTEMSAELEVDGTVPTAGTTEITIGSDTFHVTEAAATETAGDVQTVSVSGTEKIVNS